MGNHDNHSASGAGEERPPVIGLSLNRNIYKALHREARALGISTASLMREIIKERMRDPRPLSLSAARTDNHSERAA